MLAESPSRTPLLLASTPPPTVLHMLHVRLGHVPRADQRSKGARMLGELGREERREDVRD